MRVSILCTSFVCLFAISAVVSCGTENPSNPGSSSATGSSSSSSSGAGGAGGVVEAPPTPGADATVTPFDKTQIYFTGQDNKRVIDAPASFPKDGVYESIVLHLTLACPPPGGCDPWDRFASLGVVTEKGQNGAPDTVIEVARFITPYHVGASWDIDVTDLRPLLTGDLTMRAFIDTWVGPGSQFGDGWLLTASFEMKGGVPAALPIAVIPVIAPVYVPYGDPAKPVTDTVPAQTIALPSASAYALRTFVTGHGQGNVGNCAEFCKRKHTLTVAGVAHDEVIWRNDCSTTAAPNQQGTWTYSRAGWCPGADVRPWVLPITADVAGASSIDVAYDVAAYENTCRPGVAVCTGCTLGASCDYDGGIHTEPNYQLSTLLIAYK